MMIYDRSHEADLLLVQWWSRMYEAKELDLVLDASVHPLGAFVAYWRAGGRVLIYETDEWGITVAAWFEPVMNGAFAGLWIRPGRRTVPTSRRAVDRALAIGLSKWPVLIGVTKQERLLRAHERLGYTVLGRVDGLWGNDPAWIVTLTREGFEHGRRKRSSR